MKHFFAAVTVVAALGIAGCATMQAPATVDAGVLVGPNGMTLYTFDKDQANSGTSACVAKCAVAWPPLKAAATDKGDGDWSVITRDDGSKQWAYKGKPLHYWMKDQKPGDRTGDGFNKVWRLARP